MPKQRSRRSALALTLIGAALAMHPDALHAQADTYPNRTIRIICPSAAGGIIDAQARLMAEKLRVLGQAVIVENKVGAGSIIGTEFVAKAPPDGYTLLITPSTATVSNPLLIDKLPYDPVKDLTPITQIGTAAFILVGPGNMPYTNIAEMITWARQQNRPISYGTWGPTSAGHLLGERLRKVTGLNLLHVPYKLADQAIIEARTNVLDLAWGAPHAAKPMVASGQLRALAMAGARRNLALPDVPTFGEQGLQGFDIESYVGVYAPGGTPRPIIERLAKTLIDAIRTPEAQARLADFGSSPIGSTPEQFTENEKREIAKYRDLIRASGVGVSSK